MRASQHEILEVRKVMSSQIEKITQILENYTRELKELRQKAVDCDNMKDLKELNHHITEISKKIKTHKADFFKCLSILLYLK